MPKHATFARYLRTLQERHSRTVREFAELLRIDPTHLSRAMGDNGQPFDIYGCFRLAELTQENPSDVLRAAGKGALADQIEQLYGKPQPPKSPCLREVIRLWTLVEGSGDKGEEEALALVIGVLRYHADRIRTMRKSEGRTNSGVAEKSRSA